MTEAAHTTHSGPPELGNIITLLHEKWGDVGFIKLLHVWENVVFSLIIVAIISVIAYLATRKKSIIPGTLQNVVEMVVEALDEFVKGVLGGSGRKYVPFIGTLFIYIFAMNMFGLIPGMKSPTSSINTTVALAVTVFFYVQYIGLKENGFLGYIDHLMGNPRGVVGIIMVPLMLPLHILGEFIRPVSLSLRLFGNILGEDSLIAAFVVLGIGAVSFFKLPFGVPLQFPFMLLAMLTGAIQALVFALLSTIYISLMLPHHEEA